MNDLLCDSCNAKITDYSDDLFHHTGIFKGQINGHIHLCAKCQDEISPPIFNFDDALQYLNESN